jgi:hypothetical protein
MLSDLFNDEDATYLISAKFWYGLGDEEYCWYYLLQAAEAGEI